MLDPALIVLISLGYVGLLFAIAWYGDRRAERGRSVIRNPAIYTLSIAVYCTSWTFYGAVGSAARQGPEFLTIYLGPTLVFLGWWFVLRKMVRITRVHRITSIADFIASRYGKSTRLSVLVTVIAVVGGMPYISLQLKAVAGSFAVLTGFDGLSGLDAMSGEFPLPDSLPRDTAFWVAAAMAAFAVLFGTRHIDASEHHEGVVAAIAFESLVKLLAFLAVGIFITFFLHDGFADLVERAREVSLGGPFIPPVTGDSAARWITTLVLSMCAVLCLPRQFQVTAVECVDERHLSTASWLFPLYLLILSLFVVPIALAGLVHLPTGADADAFVLTVPLSQNRPDLALLAFLGGLSSATAMVIVAAITLATMVCNDLVMPFLLRLRWLRLTERGDLTGLLVAVRRASIVGLIFMGYAYYRVTGTSEALASIGLVSFAALAQLAPSMLGGLFWKGATKGGAITGLLLGFCVWCHTLLLPSFVRAGWLGASILTDGPFGVTFLMPEALFGMTTLDPLSHSLFWSWLVNIGGFVAVSLFGKQQALERIQATLYVDTFRRADSATPRVWSRTATVGDLLTLAQRFLGKDAAGEAFREFSRSRGLPLRRLAEADPDLVHLTERLLARTLGGASARVMVESVAKGEMVSLREVMTILEETSQVIEYSQRLEQKSAELERLTADLREANRQLQELDRLKDDFLSTVSHELRTPLTSIRSFSEILSDNPELDNAQRQQFLAIIVRETERLTRLIDQLLDLARLEAGHGDWHMDSVDAAAALREAVAVTASLFAEKKAVLDVEILLPEMPVHADGDRLIQVFVNLLSNAVKFVPPQDGRVRVEAREHGRTWLFTVADNGPGIPEGQRDKIFGKFVQATGGGQDRPAGTGLGLAISHQIIEHFGGSIWADASPGGGARFCILLNRLSQALPGRPPPLA
ncbi:sensor histidine kinase [Novispirillum itersonii]|uniref:histidine kinase n=1 Tax=Novispirillum itersonii TaxID=189 RepID=A0A7X0DL91_NOVIT|nr:sensor histidine kinase [Novispirillum itersonii]MBB6208909.1 Na+/proline symporter/nitrogen-specific signal transduction histidine kinase [Novispirillum itersonii]